MNRLRYAAAAALSLICALSVSAVPSKDGYRLVWEDDFNGTELNRDYWNVEINGTGCGNNELQHYLDTPENVGVRDGNLVLTAIREPYGDHDFTSGRVNTLGKVGFTYGIIEARIKLPATADGLWPAFWMMGDDINTHGWPRCGETDILEMGHSDGIKANTQDRLFNGALHWGESSAAVRQSVGPRVNPSSLQDGEYHTFTVLWTPDAIEMFVDGEATPYLSVEIAEGTDPYPYFSKDNFILFNLAVGGNFPGIHDADGITALGSAKSAEMLVDYVRVYQRDADERIVLTVDNQL